MRRGAQAIQAQQQAARIRARNPDNERDALWDRVEAQRDERKAAELRKPTARLAPAHGEVIHVDVAESAGCSKWEILDTLKNPDMVAVDASEERLNLLKKADVLESGVDAAASISASNSLERMLAHQMAAAHKAAMRLIANAFNHSHPPVEAARLTNAAARMMSIYQEGLLALHKIRTGGKQTVVVQHVHVTDGAQAVVAGSVTPGAHMSGGGDVKC